jgi:Ca2+-binding EF-hand superfamily protein
LNINQNVASVVHFADDDNYEAEEDSVSTFASAVPSYTEVEMERVAEHLRRLIRRAEEVDSVTLESAFAHFDRSHTGTITPTDLQEGLRRLGDSFSDLTLEDCSALLSCLSKKDRRQKLTANNNTSSTPTTTTPAINLLGFYRAMGRKSPPLILCSDDEEDVAPPLLRSTAPDGPGNEIGEDDNGDNDSAIQRRIGARLHHPFAVQPPVSLESSHVVHADDAASRLREIVLSAEQNEGTPLESSFRLLDPEGTGYIRANDFSSRIRNLGQGNEDTFSQIIDNEDCQELVALFDANNDGLVSLLDFYRFMGRRSPPPEVTSSDDGTNLPTDTSHDESDHVVEGDTVDAPL